MSDKGKVHPIEDGKKARERKAKEPKPPRPPSPHEQSEWWGELRKGEGGAPKASLNNAIVFLRNEPSYQGSLRWNEMSLCPELAGEPIEDTNMTAIRAHLERQYGVAFGATDIYDAIVYVSHDKTYHPVREDLKRVKWDGTVRIPSLLEQVLNAEPTPLHQAYLRKFLISLVARVKSPGCQLDTTLILQGPQGAGKSSFFKVLGGRWFNDTDMDLESKDAYLTLGRSWVIEWGELSTLNRSTQEKVKAFLTSREDVYRPPYGKFQVVRPRMCVIVGSTNKEEFLLDETGSRRFWVIPVRGKVNVQLLRELRDQILAEAQVMFDQGDPWHLSDEEEAERAEAAEAHQVQDEWTPLVHDFLRARGHSALTMAQIYEGAIDGKLAGFGRPEQGRLGGILRRAGYVKERRMHNGQRSWFWVRPDSLNLGGGADVGQR